MEATTEDLADLARVMNERGYLVTICQYAWAPGEVIRETTIERRELSPPMAVIKETDKADWLDQARIAGWTHDPGFTGHERFYRVTTD